MDKSLRWRILEWMEKYYLYRSINGKLKTSELLTWGSSGGVTVRGKYNGSMITYYFTGALTSPLGAWQSRKIADESLLKPAALATIRLSGDIYGVVNTSGEILIYNGSSSDIPENSNKELNGTLTYIL